MPKKNGKVKLQRFNFRLQRLIIGNLKGIKNFTLKFDPEKRVTAIVGVNGSGKSTIIHALACAFKPKGNETSKDFNRLSHFFTPNKDATWDGSKFLVDFSYSEFNPMHRELGAIEVHRSELFIKKPGAKQGRWLPIYGRRYERESAYIGLQDLSTLSEDKNASRYREYETEALAHESADKIKQDMVYILGRNYQSLNSCVIKKVGKIHTMFGLTYNGISYSEHSMGAGEKRVLTILSALHSQKLSKGGLLLIDEIDVLLHGAAFKRLIERVVLRAEENSIEVVFSTHRETISEFNEVVNIFGVLNTGENVLAMPHTNPQVMSQLTGEIVQPFQIYVEDELAEEIVLNLIYKRNIHSYVKVMKFGAWSNAFAVLSGKHIMGHNIDNTICVLDGDVCRTVEDRVSECQRHLNGDDRVQDRIELVRKIKEFKISHFPPEGQKGKPEYNLKMMFENFETQDQKIKDLQMISKSIQGYDDWHIYFDEMINRTGNRNVKAIILMELENSNEWSFFTKEICDWLDEKRLGI
ncbi:AAA family ATPase [Aeromonas veronii]|uniref:AAA family ATPase n=2 Tax=Aeromonas veronii TaxID=654 RepID=UPI0038D2E248